MKVKYFYKENYMFIKESIQHSAHTRKSKLGKEYLVPSKKTWYHFKCDNCGKEYQSAKNGKLILRNNIHYCSDCPQYVLMQREAAKAKLEKAKELGKKIRGGYPEIYVGPDYPHRENTTWLREHIAVMERHINSKIPEGMVVHHIDGCKTNNSIDNLLLCTIADHNRCHGKIESLVFDLYQRGLVGFNRETLEYYYIDN
jgi:ribosomal protein L44E